MHSEMFGSFSEQSIRVKLYMMTKFVFVYLAMSWAMNFGGKVFTLAPVVYTPKADLKAPGGLRFVPSIPDEIDYSFSKV